MELALVMKNCIKGLKRPLIILINNRIYPAILLIVQVQKCG